MSTIEGLTPIIDYDSKLLILGTMPGKESLRRSEYYGHPRNQFWQIIYSIFNSEFQASYEAKISFVKEKGIALWDVVKRCEREGSADSKISDICPNDFNSLLDDYPNIKSICFNSKKAYDFFQKQVKLELNRDLTQKVLPSTSPANTRLSLVMKCREWSVIKHILQV